MSDRELLELAAKAAGLSWRQDIAEYRNEKGILGLWIIEPMKTLWNPLTDDGDALRLAVSLFLSVSIISESEFVWVCHEDAGLQVCEPTTFGANEATRRAIVRAAAEIGRAMP